MTFDLFIKDFMAACMRIPGESIYYDEAPIPFDPTEPTKKPYSVVSSIKLSTDEETEFDITIQIDFWASAAPGQTEKVQKMADKVRKALNGILIESDDALVVLYFDSQEPVPDLEFDWLRTTQRYGGRIIYMEE